MALFHQEHEFGGSGIAGIVLDIVNYNRRAMLLESLSFDENEGFRVYGRRNDPEQTTAQIVEAMYKEHSDFNWMPPLRLAGNEQLSEPPRYRFSFSVTRTGEKRNEEWDETTIGATLSYRMEGSGTSVVIPMMITVQKPDPESWDTRVRLLPD